MKLYGHEVHGIDIDTIDSQDFEVYGRKVIVYDRDDSSEKWFLTFREAKNSLAVILKSNCKVLKKELEANQFFLKELRAKRKDSLTSD
jgi:uroporphyrinogen-III synthase